MVDCRDKILVYFSEIASVTESSRITIHVLVLLIIIVLQWVMVSLSWPNIYPSTIRFSQIVLNEPDH